MNPDNNYWNSKGRYKVTADRLNLLVPASGEVENPKQNPALERYRKATNCYYDLFNNGLSNRSAEFRALYGFSPRKVAPKRFSPRYDSIDFDNPELLALVDAKMDMFILRAAREQGVEIVETFWN